jgi:hypothetical protein
LIVQCPQELLVPVGSGHCHDGDTSQQTIQFNVAGLVSCPSSFFRSFSLAMN